MPLYDVEYVTPLTPKQQEQLAIAFTEAHAKRFNTPRYFVNVRYTDASNQVVFRGGIRRKYNRVILRTRAGSNRSNDLYLEHCNQIVSEWERIVGKEGQVGLRTVWVMGALTTALEAGIGRPKVRNQSYKAQMTWILLLTVSLPVQTGEEDEWLKDNISHFRALAAAGDEDFVELMKELEGKVNQ